MIQAVLDASAVLALLRAEPGAELVEPLLPAAVISSVNLSEVISKLTDAGMTPSSIDDVVEALGLAVAVFDETLARRASLLRTTTRAQGLSLGDRACLALALQLDVPAWTADTIWQNLNVGVVIQLIR